MERLHTHPSFAQRWKTTVPWSKCTQTFLWVDTGRQIGSLEDPRKNTARRVIRVLSWSSAIFITPLIGEELWGNSGSPTLPKPGKRFNRVLGKHVDRFCLQRPLEVVGLSMNLATNTLAVVVKHQSSYSGRVFCQVSYVDTQTWEVRRKSPPASFESRATVVYSSCLGDDDVLVLKSSRHLVSAFHFIGDDSSSVWSRVDMDLDVLTSVSHNDYFFVAAPGGGFYVCVLEPLTEFDSSFRVYGPWYAQFGEPSYPLPTVLSLKTGLVRMFPAFCRISPALYAVAIPGPWNATPIDATIPTLVVCFELVPPLRRLWILACVFGGMGKKS